MKTSVGIISCEYYDAEKIESAFNHIAGNCGFPDVEGKTVLLKPNILSASEPAKAVTTHPEFIRAAIRFVKKRHPAQILVGDSPGVGSPVAAARKSGIIAMLEEEELELSPMLKPVSVRVDGALIQKQFFIAEEAIKADVIISLPKLKTHQMMYFTGAMKNLFGVIPGLKKSQFHFRFPEKDDFALMLCDLNRFLKPAYSFMDGILSMEGHGPGSGDPIKTDLVLGGSDLLAVDIAASQIIGYKPENIPLVKAGLASDFGISSLKDIDYPMLSPDEARIKDFQLIKVLKDTGMLRKTIPEGLYKLIQQYYVPRPIFSKSKCILCRKCIEICPADVLKVKGKRIKINTKECIRCYCCHEVCPVDAIRIGRV